MPHRRLFLTLFAALLAALLLAGCANAAPSAPTETAPPSATPAPSETPPPPSATLTLTASATASQTPSQTPSSTPTASATASSTATPTETPTETATNTPAPAWADPNAIKIYLTHLGTGGPLACGDTLVGISSGLYRTGNVEEDVRLALNALFASGQKVGAYHNATYPSSFRVSEVEFIKSEGTVVVTLSGSYVKPADYCEARRYREQVWATARQFPEVNRATIWLDNGKLLGDLLYAVTNKP